MNALDPTMEGAQIGDATDVSVADAALRHGASMRFVALDGMRGVAAVWIVLFHVDWINHITGNWSIRSAYLAVDLFFILSGFVIFWTYGDQIHNSASFGHFLRLRFFRIYPLHIAVLAGLVVLEGIKLVLWRKSGGSGQPPFTGTTGIGPLVANALLLQGSGFFSELSWNYPSWSISSEFLAYIAFAVATMAGLLQRPRIVWLAAVIGCLTYALISFSKGTLNVVYWSAPLRCLAGFAIGVLLADLRRRGRLALVGRLPDGVLSALQILCVLALVMGLYIGSTAWSAVNIPIFALLICFVQFDRGQLARLLCGTAVQAVGLWSYSIYMVHAVLLLLVDFVLKRTGLVKIPGDWGNDLWNLNPIVGDVLVVAVMGIVIVVSSQTYRFIEEPGRRIGRNPRLWIGRSRAVGTLKPVVRQ